MFSSSQILSLEYYKSYNNYKERIKIDETWFYRTFRLVCNYIKEHQNFTIDKYKRKESLIYRIAAGMLYILQKNTISCNAQLLNMRKTSYLRNLQYSMKDLPGCLYCHINNGLTYLNRKYFQSLNAQILCDEKLYIIYSYCYFPGRTSDSNAIKNTYF